MGKSPPPLSHPLAPAGIFSVEAMVSESGEIPALAELEELSRLCIKSDDGYKVTGKGKMLTLFATMAKYGELPKKRFRPEMDGLHAFSHEVGNVQIRFPCFRDGNKWIVTHGFKKPGAKKKRGAWPKAQIERAVRLREEYRTRKAQRAE